MEALNKITGIQLKPSTISIRLIILSSTLFGFVLLQSYSAILLSQLAINQIPSPVHLEKLPSAMPHRSLCVSERSIAYSNFLENDSTEILPQWKPILNRQPCTVGQIDIIPLQDYCNEKTIVLESKHNTNYIRNKAILIGSNSVDCSFYSFPRRYFNTYFSLLTKKDFRYTSLISIYLLKFHTTGIIKRLQDVWLPISPVQGVEVKSNEAIKFVHMKDLLLLYLLAALISLIILSIEIITHIASTYELVTKIPPKIIKRRETLT